MEYALLSELSLQKQNCKIKVRVCRIWESTAPFLKGDIFSLDCLFVDEKGYSLQGIIRKQDVEEIRCRLAEGSVYLIEKFSVVPAKKKYAAVERLHMIQLNKWTSLTLIEGYCAEIPLYSFSFLPFPRVEKQKYNDAVLTDVMGQVTAIGEVTQKYVQQTITPIRNLEIQDLERNVLSVTLWDDFALGFDDSTISRKAENGPVVLVLAGLTVRSYREKIHLSTCSVSKIYIDLEIPEVLGLLNSLQTLGGSIQRIEASHEPLISPQEEMCSNRKTIVGLLDLDISSVQNVKFTCQAKIVDIDTSFGWWYKACYNCKAAVKTHDDTFYCSNCPDNDQPPIPWYKLNIIVSDGDNSANFIVFGKIAQELICIPAHILAISPGSDQFTVTPAMKTIIGQEHVFQVVTDTLKFRTSMPSFKVLKIFTLTSNVKGKSPMPPSIRIKCEEDPQSPATTKQIHKEIFLDSSPSTAVSPAPVQLADDVSEVQHTKKLRLTFAESTPPKENEEDK